MATKKTPLRVFISYSHEGGQHAERVAALAHRLRQDRIDCRIDQNYVRPPEGWPAWMDRQIAEADTILVICTQTYRERFDGNQPPGEGRGVCWESLLMRSQLYRAGSLNEKLLPVIFHPDNEQHIPDALYSFDRACVNPGNVDHDEAYQNLLRLIHRVPTTEMLPLGPTAALPTMSVQQKFFQPEDAQLLVETSALPATGPELFGRDGELELLDRAWENPQKNVITLVAFGGVGKTALVKHWLARMGADDYRGARRVYGWSAYSQGSKDRAAAADLFIDRALRFFGDQDPEAGSLDQRAVRLANLIRGQKTLLVLDGIESLQYAPGPSEGHIKDTALRTLVRELAAWNSGLCVITTRAAVADLADQQQTTCPRIDLEQLKPADGARLLKALDVRGDEKELLAASEEFGGHALALTLLGTFLRDVHAGEIRKRGEIGELKHKIEEGGHARRVMESYENWLGEGPERSILRMLGLFNRPAPAGAIRALRADQPIDEADWTKALIRLRRAQLVAKADPTEPDSLDAHPWVREHFGWKLREENESAWRAGHDRLFDYYRGEGCPKERPDTIDEMAPLYAAVTHGCAAGRHTEALDEVYCPRIQRDEEGYSSKKLGAFGSELATLSGFFDPPWSAPVGGLSDAANSFVLGEAGYALRALGRMAEAVESMKAGLDADVQREDWENAARAGGNLSELHLTLGRVDEAIELVKQAVDYADDSKVAFEQMSTLATLADALHQAGRVDRAEALFEKAEVMQKERQPQFPLLYSLPGYRYCDLLLDQGRWEDVLKRAAQTLKWATKQNLLLDIGLDHLSLARASVLAARAGRASAIDEARTHAEAAVDTLRQARTQHHVPRGLLGRAVVYRFDDDAKSARADLDEAMAIATRDPAGHMKLYEVDIHLAYARLEFDAGNAQQAQDHVAAADKLINQTGYHRRDGELEELGRSG